MPYSRPFLLPRVIIRQQSTSTPRTTLQEPWKFPYSCGLPDAEPIWRYGEGGLHPISLGDKLKDGRYKVLHKLGWGGHSTVWAARDQRDGINVAIKVCGSARGIYVVNREMQMMKELARIYPGPSNLMRMLDAFDIEGPNGRHECLVLELLGPSVEEAGETRLSGKIAKSIAKQALSGLDALHRQGIGHGDLYTRKLAFTLPDVDRLSERELLNVLGEPEISHVIRENGGPLEPGMPEYIVNPVSFREHGSILSQPIKIVDFGQSFMHTAPPETIYAPIPYRAPEIVFKDRLDYRIDLWSMGCTLFTLFASCPPFESAMMSERDLVFEMLEVATDPLPDKWREAKDELLGGSAEAYSGYTLQGWLNEIYFDSRLKQDLNGRHNQTGGACWQNATV